MPRGRPPGLLGGAVMRSALLRRFATIAATFSATLWRSASIRSTTFDGLLSARRSIFSPFASIQKVLQSIFVAILEFLGVELSPLRLHDVRRQLKHVLGDLLVLDVAEV